MTIEYDEKGKFYTEVVTKVPTSVVIQTTTHLVRGLVHVRQGERLKDELEVEETQATVIFFHVPCVIYEPGQPFPWRFPGTQRKPYRSGILKKTADDDWWQMQNCCRGRAWQP